MRTPRASLSSISILALSIFALEIGLPQPSRAEQPTPEEGAPVPPAPPARLPQPEAAEKPGELARKKRSIIAPGFETSEPSTERPGNRSNGGGGKRDARAAEEEELRRPVDVPSQGVNERLIDDINHATGEVTLAELLDEILADVVAELDARPAKWFSPLAIRQVSLGSNVSPGFARKLKSTITAEIQSGTEVRVVDCMECEATRTRLEQGQWVVTRGIVDTNEMRRVAETIGVKSFMDVAFGFDPQSGVLEMDFRVVRATDAYVLWADSFRADETTPLLARSSDAPVKRKDRLRDLEMLLEGRPLYGYVASAGFMLIPHNDPIDGDIGGATAGYRIYERFGRERRVMFGLDMMGFLNASRLAGAVISAGSWWIPIRPDLVNPELRLGAKAGAFIAGTAGNAAVFQLGAEVLLRYRFGLFAYVLFMTKSPFPPDSGNSLGGVGLSTGMSFNW